MDRSELQFTLADLVCAMLLLSALIGTLATHADHAHYIWYYLPVLLVCEATGLVISYTMFHTERARRSAVTAVWTTVVGALIGIVLPLAVMMAMPLALFIAGAILNDRILKRRRKAQPLPPALEKAIEDAKRRAAVEQSARE